MYPTMRAHRSCAWTGALLMLCGLSAACASHETAMPSPTDGGAVVHNSIEVGLIETTFFVVDSVDGVKVHERLDFKRRVDLPVGRHELAVTYYTDALWGSRDSAETCTVAIDAEPNGIYRLEGEAEHGDWRAHLVDSRTGQEVPCLFAGETAPAADPASRKEIGATAPPPVVAGAASSGAGPKPVEPVATAKQDEADSSKSLIARLMGRFSRRSSFCPRGFYRVGHSEGDTTFVLERSERVRLIGVQSESSGVRPATTDPIGLTGKCVRFDYEPTNLIDGHRDRDGRLLAYVYTADGTFVNLELIREGVVRASDDRHQHLAEFLAAQSAARKAGVGVWAQ